MNIEKGISAPKRKSNSNEHKYAREMYEKMAVDDSVLLESINPKHILTLLSNFNIQSGNLKRFCYKTQSNNSYRFWRTL